MPVEAESATATATPSPAPAVTPAPDSGAAPAAAVTPAAETPATPSTPSAEKPAAPPAAPIDVHKDLMAAATAAVAKAKGEPSPQQDTLAGAANGTAKADEVAAAKDKSNATVKAEVDDESKPPPFNDHPRWKKLQRDFTTATGQVKALTPRAEQYDKITAYMDQFGLTSEDVAMAYDILAKMKTNPI